MNIFNKDCPVPNNQQPLNEYLELKNSWFFSWSTYNTKVYISILSFIILFLLLVCGYIVSCLYLNNLNKISFYQFFVLDCVFVDIFLVLILLRLYLGWSYVMTRLLSASIFYEESGWYDGQIWIKTASILTRDRLVSLYQVIPFLNRIKYTLLVFCFNCIFHFYLYYSF